MEEEEVLCRFGTPLKPLEEDEIPSKKPIAIEDQIVTDSHGRRRFHGAFTGGFSAGFWNTVGSLEGWKPQTFKSSRLEKAEKKEQKPTDFMDDEDFGEFGIAPQRVQTTDDFTPQDSNSKSDNRKRKFQQNSGPIPGIPVLHNLLQPAKENVAIRLLKKMGWKLGQGVGARQTRKEKKATAERNARERYVMKKYGCDLGPLGSSQAREDEKDTSSESEISDEDITFAPDDFEPLVCGIKDNTFGLGYTGLNRNPVLKKQHVDLFGPFEVLGEGNKKLSIRGQAFGVGALEEEDEDIYANEDLSKYDFSLDDKKKEKQSKGDNREDLMAISGFHIAKDDGRATKKVFVVSLPAGFKPRNWCVRKTRFEPLDENRVAILKRQDEHKVKGLGRHDLNPEERGSILGEAQKCVKTTEAGKDAENSDKARKRTYLEKINEKYKGREVNSNNLLDILNSKVDIFTKGEVINADLTKPNELDESAREENEKVLLEAKKITESLSEVPAVFKPFVNNEMKQERYEKFIEANLKSDEEITKFLSSIQPLDMSEWDREMEKKEFLQASRIYKPLKGLMSDRFVSEATVLTEKKLTEQLKETSKKVEIKRTKVMWKPCALLCKRFNVAEPFGGAMIEEKPKKKPRFSVFDYIEASVNTKDNFVTPVIIPTKAEKPKSIVKQDTEQSYDKNRLSTKDLFIKELEKSKEPPASTSKQITLSEGKRDDESKATSSKEQPKKFIKPKTELEKKIEETKNKHPSEKKDLFKAIFESSSEDEDETEEQDGGGKKEDVDSKKSSSAPMDIIQSLTKPAAEINVLRNTSPPRGIFAYLFARKEGTEKKVEKDENKARETVTGPLVQEKDSTESPKKDSEIIMKSRSEEGSDVVNVENDNKFYGPKVPTSSSSIVCLNAETVPEVKSTPEVKDNNDEKILKLLKKNKSKVEVVEEWVEKSEALCGKKKKKSKDKKKKSKKHKKEKKHKNKK